MNVSPGWLVLFLGIGFVGSCLCSGAETGFVTWNSLKVLHQARRGRWSAQWALFLLRHKDRLLAAILIGNNICNIGVTLLFSDIWRRLEIVLPLLAPLGPVVEPLLLAPSLLIFCEMLPKSLFRIYSYRMTIRAVPFLMLLFWVTVPINWVYGLFLKLLHSQAHSGEEFITKKREEMVLVAGEGARRGFLLESVTAFMQSLLSKRTVSGAFYLPRASQELVDSQMNCREALRRLKGWRGSEAPVFAQGSPVGVLRISQLLAAPGDTVVNELMIPLSSGTQSGDALACLSEFAGRPERFFLLSEPQGQKSRLCDKSAFFAFHYLVRQGVSKGSIFAKQA